MIVKCINTLALKTLILRMIIVSVYLFKMIANFMNSLSLKTRLAVLSLGGSAGCASALENSSGLRGPTPQAFTPFGGCYCLVPEAPQKKECRRGRRYFWPCRTRVGFGPATGPTLKTALCHMRALVGRMINN